MVWDAYFDGLAMVCLTSDGGVCWQLLEEDGLVPRARVADTLLRQACQRTHALLECHGERRGPSRRTESADHRARAAPQPAAARRPRSSNPTVACADARSAQVPPQQRPHSQPRPKPLGLGRRACDDAAPPDHHHAARANQQVAVRPLGRAPTLPGTI